jgi:hypothetical protein
MTEKITVKTDRRDTREMEKGREGETKEHRM